MSVKSYCEQYLFLYELIDSPEQVELPLQEALGHLRECNDCREYWESSQNLDKIIRIKLQQTVLPSSLHVRVMERLTNYRGTDIRQIVYEAVCAYPSHLSLRAIFGNISARFPNLTLQKVKRNLNCLVSQQKLLKLNLGEGFQRYDGNITPHNHLLCQKCLQVFDLPALSDAELVGLNTQGHQISGAGITLRGICRNCKPAH